MWLFSKLRILIENWQFWHDQSKRVFFNLADMYLFCAFLTGISPWAFERVDIDCKCLQGFTGFYTDSQSQTDLWFLSLHNRSELGELICHPSHATVLHKHSSDYCYCLTFHEILKACLNNMIFSDFWPVQVWGQLGEELSILLSLIIGKNSYNYERISIHHVTCRVSCTKWSQKIIMWVD